MYCTNTIYKNGNTVEDKGLFMEGLEHAKNCCLSALQNDATIKEIHLLGLTPSDNHIVRREQNKKVFKNVDPELIFQGQIII